MGTLSEIVNGFNGSGTTLASPGTPIFLFAFDNPNPDFASNFVLATSSDPSFLVPSDGGSTHLNAAATDIYKFGSPFGLGMQLSEGLPFPEPASAVLGMLFALSVPSFRPRYARSR